MLDKFSFVMASKIVFALSCLVCYLRADGIPLQLPDCNPAKIKGSSSNNYIMISTLDGRLTAFDLENGSKAWEIETSPLLSSNLASTEFDGEDWVRLVPSLRGTLYTVHGSKIKRLPFNVHQLLSETFTESNNLITAGGHDILRIGIDTKSGRVIYTCNSSGCNNEQQTTETGGDVLVLTRQSTTIRGLDPRTGLEKWNFSTAAHDLQLSRGECGGGDRIRAESSVNMMVSMRKNLVTILSADDNEPLWENELEAPITDVWELYDGNLRNVLWQESRSTNVMGQLLYVGDHQGQLYIMDEFDKSQETKNLMLLPNTVNRQFISLDRQNVYLPLSDKSTYVPYYEAEDTNTTEVSSKVKSVKSWITDIVAAVSLALALIFIMAPFFVRVRIMVSVVWDRMLPEKKIQEIQPEDIPQIKRSSSEYPGRYEKDFTTVRRLGKGGFGVVFEAKNNIDDRSYAVKRITLPKKKEHHERVLLEAKALAKLEHQNIVQYFTAWIEPCPPNRCQSSSEMDSTSYISKKHIDLTESEKSSFIVFGNPDEITEIKSKFEPKTSEMESKGGLTSNGMTSSELEPQSDSKAKSKSEFDETETEPRLELYIQMQLCDPNSLYDWLRNNRECSDRYVKVKDIFGQIVSAVECVHLKRLIHRDLKPSNIMFAPNGQVKIGDFGLVTYMHDTTDNTYHGPTPVQYDDWQHTHGVGTEVYMSPEQRKKKPYNYKVDIYSLGLILFELLKPFDTESERAVCLTKIRDQTYPEGFEEKYPNETDLLRLMLNEDPSRRPTTYGIRARAPLYEITDEMYHFELPPPLTAV